jgi:LmbE family N-acetylglucosaminyl deacetylase
MEGRMADTTSVAFYVGAHQDDWQLFMSPQAYYDLTTSGTRVVFIYTTFGEAGDI